MKRIIVGLACTVLLASLVAFSSFLSFLSWNGTARVFAATLRTAEEISRVINIQNVSYKNGEVSGTVVNKSPNTLRDVQLQIRYSWRWKKEFRPKEDTVGETVIYKVDKEIPAGGTASFAYKHPVPSREDGYYETSVSIAGYTEVIQPSK